MVCRRATKNRLLETLSKFIYKDDFLALNDLQKMISNIKKENTIQRHKKRKAVLYALKSYKPYND